ncbi:16S rRNA (cytosine(1402)-N(4))-methyltransferase RsmH [Candidatus Collierbacteria bacterium]|nr:16S rRNA (cytosine(1402)-N(4))-methyltransferase RsmH [Candidatus Collierbacteria bacterium]
MSTARHNPAFTSQIADLFHLKKGDLFLDLTLGDGGHTQEALEAGAKVVSIDVDLDAINRATNFVPDNYKPIIIRPEMDAKLPDEFTWLIIHTNFKDIGKIKEKFNLPLFDAVLADLGTSQYQLSVAERGFSFKEEGLLDMRLDNRLSLTAADLVNALSEKELEELLHLVDEYQARTIAKAIVKERKIEPITSTTKLAKLIVSVKKGGKGKIHPATKTFMALRMAVNLEREALQTMLTELPALMKKGATVGIISFHSGEDRLVKRFFKEQAKTRVFQVINVKPIRPSQYELQNNPKVRSAKLRLAEKIG